jgi:hypothetical protein
MVRVGRNISCSQQESLDVKRSSHEQPRGYTSSNGGSLEIKSNHELTTSRIRRTSS